MAVWLRCAYRTVAIATMALVGSGIAPAFARCDQDEARQAVEAGQIRPLIEILNIVRGKLPGEVVRTKLEQKGELWLYEFRVVDRKGQLFDVHVDARSGEIKGMREK